MEHIGWDVSLSTTRISPESGKRAALLRAPRLDESLDEYWRRWSPQWKPSAQETHAFYRRHYLDGAFPAVFIELNEAHVTIGWSDDLGGLPIDPEVRRHLAAFRTALEGFDVLAMPATPVFAPPATCDRADAIDGTHFYRYFEWQRYTCRVTVMAYPALSVPAGFSDGGLPIGLQLVGRYRDEAGLLSVAAAIEDATGSARCHPPELD